ncbi:MAG: hypothetical protein N2Z72_07780 [Bacteroidales bacterium]|nr:hypothetical protein [Bacteroidales bacterium]
MKHLLSIFFSSLSLCVISQNQVLRPPIGTYSQPEDAEIKLTLIARFQSYEKSTKDNMDFYDPDIVSPKSVAFLEEKGKIYINSLEGFCTVVYDTKTFKKLKTIRHEFTLKDQNLFIEKNCWNYVFRNAPGDINVFQGKPVEMCFSHNKKYLWVTYYRRSYDTYSINPSAVAIIDTDKDSIIRVMMTGPIPKMITASPDNKYIAVTHWGDNTVGIINISSSEVKDFFHERLLVVDYQSHYTPTMGQEVDRDKNCGLCLRGTAFTTDGKYLLVGRMGGGGIAVFETRHWKYLGTIFGTRPNVRHLIVTSKWLYLTSSRTGFVQKTSIENFLKFALDSNQKNKTYHQWQEVYAGADPRTMVLSHDEKYIFVACNGSSSIAVIRNKDMKKIAEIRTNSFPVGLAIRKGDFTLISTSQAHPGVGGGNSVNVFFVKYR